MRRLIVSTLVSLDGVVDAPDKLLAHWNEENRAFAVEELRMCDAIFFGRVTYGMFAARWPQVKNDPFGDLLNSLPKYVATRTLRETPWQGTTVLKDATQLAALQNEPGKNIIKYGLGDVDRTLLEHRLVDELRVSIVPVVLGAGRRLFEGLPSVPLRLTNTKSFTNGIVRIFYDVVKG